MATVRPFKALRPAPELAARVAALPYDVMSSDEARALAKDNPYTFLHVEKSEIDLPREADPYSPEVYKKAHDNLYRMLKDGVLLREEKPCFYVYKQVMDGRVQIGIAGCPSIDDYMNDVIKKHELTRREKEEDRLNHVDTCGANTGLVFLAYKSRKAINDIVARAMAGAPVYDFDFNGVQQTVWVIERDPDIETIQKEFVATDYLYIADGHHRCASAVRVGKKRREEHPGYTGNEEFNYILAVLFPDDQLYIMDYNRVVKDLNGMREDQFMAKVREKFDVHQYLTGTTPYHPEKKHMFGMYLNYKWYVLTAKEDIYDDSDPVEGLDVSVLQNNLLAPVLGIGDPRSDKRIDFVGGIRGLKELERRANGDMQIAFSMYPTAIEDLMKVANAGKVMPPKSTWFEPKLLSGLFVHELD